VSDIGMKQRPRYNVTDSGERIHMSDCKLRASNGAEPTHCDGDTCVFWRALEHLGTGDGEGCAIQHYQLLADDGIAAWLLSVKERVERTVAAGLAGAATQKAC
jgi:hypothetical protein